MTDSYITVNKAPALTNEIGAINLKATDNGDGTYALVCTDNGPAWTPAYTHTASADMTTTAALTAAPTSGQKIVIDDIIFSTGTAMNFTFEEETSGTDVLKIYVPANTTIQLTPRGKIKLATANKKLHGVASVAGNVAVTVCYHSEA
jgi:hypothetical protein